MNIRFYIDPGSGLPHIYKHGVEEKSKRCLRILAKIAPGETGQGSSSVKLALDAFCESFTFVIRNRTVFLL